TARLRIRVCQLIIQHEAVTRHHNTGPEYLLNSYSIRYNIAEFISNREMSRLAVYFIVWLFNIFYFIFTFLVIPWISRFSIFIYLIQTNQVFPFIDIIWIE